MAMVYVVDQVKKSAIWWHLKRLDIHGAGATTEYLDVSPSFKNPADTSDAQGIKITIVRLLSVVLQILRIG